MAQTRKRRGRPPSKCGPSPIVPVTFHPAQDRALRERARAHGRSFAAEVRRCVDHTLRCRSADA